MNRLSQFIKQLREEAKDVKSCFTTYSIQSIIFSAAVLAAMFSMLDKFPLAVFSCIPVIILLMIISRIGIYKYATANRLYGYELHIGRTYRYNKNSKQKKQLYRDISWEEAQRAWRIVQTRVFRELYTTPECDRTSKWLKKTGILNWINYFRPNLYRYNNTSKNKINHFRALKDINEKMAESEYPWFDLRILTEVNIGGLESDSYHAGTYLKNILGMLILMQHMLLVPIVVLFFKDYTFFDSKMDFILIFVFITMFSLINLRSIRVNNRRKILENEFLSIHSCSIIWQAIVLAHHLALRSCPKSYKFYTLSLLQQANDISSNIFNIHGWIDAQSEELTSNLAEKTGSANQ